MESNGSQTPDLASVLRTLASLAPPMQQFIGHQPEQVQSSTCLTQTSTQTASNVEQQPWPQRSTTPPYPPQPQSFHSQYSQQPWPPRSTTPPYPPPPQSYPTQHGQQPNQQSWNQRPEYGHQQPPQQAKNVVDPSTIIEWSAGLRCVMKTVAKNENIVKEIQRMMKVQHEHEEQWWNGRKALIERLAARKEGKKKLDEVLRAVGGLVGPDTSDDGPEALARELETFDMKVYKAQMQMVREMNSRLRNLGVPFFGTKTDLVRPAGREVPKASSNEDSKDEQEMIDEVDLVKLQRKMLAMLEDLSNE